MAKLIKCIRTFGFAFFFAIIFINSFGQNHVEYIFVEKIKSTILYDTIFNNSTATLISKIVAKKDTICINAYYKKPNNDFSFYYINFLDSVDIELNSKKLPFANIKYSPYIQKYLLLNDSIEKIKIGPIEYLLIFGRPFFCNSIYCSDISVLIIRSYNSTISCLEINSLYCDEIDLFIAINNRLINKRKLFIPIKKNCKSSIKNWIDIETIFK